MDGLTMGSTSSFGFSELRRGQVVLLTCSTLSEELAVLRTKFTLLALRRGSCWARRLTSGSAFDSRLPLGCVIGSGLTT